MDNTAQAKQLLEQGTELCLRREWKQAVEVLERALELDRGNPLIVTRLVNALLSMAYSAMVSGSEDAKALIERALALDPSNPLAQSYLTMWADQKRTAFVDSCLARARELKLAGDLQGARAVIQEGLARYPQDSRLAQFELQDASPEDASRVLARRSDLEQAQRMVLAAAGVREKTGLLNLRKGLRELAAKYPGDAEFEALEQELERRIAAWEAPPVAKTSPQMARPATASTPTGQEPVALPHQTPAAAPPQKAQAAYSMRAVIMGVALGLILFSAIAYVWLIPRPQPRALLLQVQVIPPQARLLLDGNPINAARGLPLQEGKTSVLRAELDGYRPVEQQVDARTPSPVLLRLEPLPALLQVQTDLEQGALIMDHVRTELIDGRAEVPRLAAGEHVLLIDGGRQWKSQTLRFEVQPGQAPRLISGLPAEPNLRYVILSSYRNQARLHCNFAPTKVSVGPRQYDVPVDGLDFEIGRGAWELSFAGENEMQIPIELGGAPTLLIHLAAGNYGTLEILTNDVAPDAVYLDNRRRRPRARGKGRFALDNVPPGPHEVRIQKEGFTIEPERRSVVLGKRGFESLRFQLSPKLVTASLRIIGGLPGAEVQVAGVEGVIGPNGQLELGSITPGQHDVVIRKQGYETRIVRKEFTPGTAVHLSAAEAYLSPPQFRITFAIVPGEAQARVHISRVLPGTQGQFSTIARNHDPSQPVRLEEGHYRLEVEAEGFLPSTREVTVNSAREFRIELTRRETPKAAPPKAPPAKPQWVMVTSNQDRVFGKGYGQFRITIRHKGDIRWLAAAVDKDNFEEFRLDGKWLHWQREVNGKRRENGRQPFQMKLPEEFTLEIQAAAGGLEQRLVLPDGSTRVLPAVRGALPVPETGQYVIRIKRGDQLQEARAN